MSSLLDQVEAKVARAKRAFRQSRGIIAAAGVELERHGRWLDRHRAAWAEEVKCHHRLLNRKLSIGACTRIAVGLILGAPFALAQAFRLPLRQRPSRASAQLNFAETAPHRTRHAQFQHRIRGLDGQLCTMEPADLRPTSGWIAMRGECSPIPDGEASRPVASFGSFLRSRALVSAFGGLTLLIAVGVVGATRSNPSAEAPVLAALNGARPPQHAVAVPVTVPKPPGKTQRSTPTSGFAVLAATSTPELLVLPAQTIADMMLIARPLSLAPREPETTTAPVAEEPLVSKPARKSKPKRLVKREPRQLPWWQRWSWIRVR